VSVRFGDLLKATVLLSAASATLLGALTVISLSRTLSETAAYLCVAWWTLAALIGNMVGNRDRTSPAITNLLATARTQTLLPELHPGRMIANRLWPLLLATFGAAALSFVFPQVGGIAAGFGIIWALAWRRQEAAVSAIEERDGVRFYVERTSPLKPIKLVRTPGFSGDFLSPSAHR
jgi:hypothetical protein